MGDRGYGGNAGNAEYAYNQNTEGYYGKEAPGKKQKRILGVRWPILAAMGILLLIVIAVAIAVPISVVQNNKKSAQAASASASAAAEAASSTLSLTATPTATHTGPEAEKTAAGTKTVESSSSTTATTATSSLSSHSSSATSSSSRTSSISSRSSSATASSSSAAATDVKILSAYYGGEEVTSAAKDAFVDGNSLSINTTPINLTDPWMNVKKCLSILNSAGSSIYTFVACESDGEFSIKPGSPGSSNNQEITRQGPTSSNFAIVSVVWGALEIRDEAVYKTIFDLHSSGSSVPLSNDLFGNDTLVNWQKSGVIWYTEDDFKTIKALSGKEGDSVVF